MQITRLMDTNNISVFIGFTFMTNMGVFRIMRENEICRLILHQRVVVSLNNPFYLSDLRGIDMLSLLYKYGGRRDEYRKEEIIARFYRLHCRRYWIPEPVTINDKKILTEWAEYQTDEFQIDFAPYSKCIGAYAKGNEV